MKKLLLLLSLLLATNVWGETKYLKCIFSYEEKKELRDTIIEISFDPRLPNVEVSITEASHKKDVLGELSVYPTFLKFSFALEEWGYYLEVNREDLVASFHDTKYGRQIVEPVTCQLVRGKKTNYKYPVNTTKILTKFSLFNRTYT